MLRTGGIGTDVLLIIALFLAPVECMTQYVKYQAGTVFSTMLYYYMYPYIPWIFCDLAFWAACMGAVGVSISHSAPLILLALQKIAKKMAMKKKIATHPDFERTRVIHEGARKAGMFADGFLDKLLLKYDKNGDGVLDRVELDNLIGELLNNKQKQAEFVGVVFDMCDSNSDGKISVEELQLVFAILTDMEIAKTTSATEWAAIRSGQSKKAN